MKIEFKQIIGNEVCVNYFDGKNPITEKGIFQGTHDIEGWTFIRISIGDNELLIPMVMINSLLFLSPVQREIDLPTEVKKDDMGIA
jgi:hypothetical protein